MFRDSDESDPDLNATSKLNLNTLRNGVNTSESEPEAQDEFLRLELLESNMSRSDVQSDEPTSLTLSDYEIESIDSGRSDTWRVDRGI